MKMGFVYEKFVITVEFKVEFYKVDSETVNNYDEKGFKNKSTSPTFPFHLWN